MEISRASKRGDCSYLYDREKNKFVNYIHKTYPEWVECVQARIFNETVPYGSMASRKTYDCEDIEVLKSGAYHDQ